MNIMQTGNRVVSRLEAERLQKLRVNRVAIIQVLRVEHVIPSLISKHVLTEEDKKIILSAKSTQDKVRRLLDILPGKGRLVDWFGAFRDALKFPDTGNTEIKKRYGILVEFLDNTILPTQIRPKYNSVDSSIEGMKLPKYDPLPGIADSVSPFRNGGNGSMSRVTFDMKTDQEKVLLPSGQEKGERDQEYAEHQNKEEYRKKRRTLLKGFFHKWISTPESFTFLIKEPVEHFKQLRDSSDPEDQKQLKQEKEALLRIWNMEVVFALDRHHQLPKGFEICMSGASEELLADSNLYHLYFKYFEQLKLNHFIDMPKHLAASFINLLDLLEDARDEEIRTNVIRLGFGLFDLLNQYGMYERAENVMIAIVIYLVTTADIGAWLATYEAFVKLMSIRNVNINFSDADAVYNAAQQVVHKIKLMSFGKEVLSTCRLNLELSVLLREQGTIGPSYDWAQQALQTVEPTNHQDVVDCLCNASLAYSNKLLVKKAEQLSVQAVRYAKKFFGTRHPTYIQALLNYCQYSSEYRQDDMGIDVARKALETCKKIYGDAPNMQMALSLQALARALVVNYQFTDDEYYNCAMDAWRMAISVLSGTHPRLALFRFTLAQCLLWHATHASENKQLGLLTWAETECSGALARFKAYWGQYSLKAGHAYSLLGQIYTKMGRLEEAEKILRDNLLLHKLSLPQQSHFTYLAEASLGTFYQTTDKPLEALELLKDVVNNIDCGGVYLRWVHVCYDTIIDLLNAVNHEKEAESFQTRLIDWMKKNPKPSQQLTWEHLHADPEPYDQFFDQFDTTIARFKAAKELINLTKTNSDGKETDKD